MIFFPNCKINLGLNIISKRQDGYHEIETIFYPVNISDALEIIETRDKSSNNVHFSSTGITIDCAKEDNSCIKAYDLLSNHFPRLPSIKMHLHKVIPIGAGLGGGSADAAFTISLLNKKLDLKLSKDQLLKYALELGSDCPFFIINKPCLAQGRGEILQEINIDFSTYKFLIVNPQVNINTRWAYSQVHPKNPVESIRLIIQKPVETWREELMNDFEQSIFNHYPELQAIKDELYKNGAIYAGMSGSGSTLFGIFRVQDQIGDFVWPKKYFVKEVLPF